MRVADIGYAKDAQQIQTNIVRVDGQRSRLPAGAEAGRRHQHDRGRGWRPRSCVKHLFDVPKELVTNVVFDQSRFVKTAIETLLHEGAIGLFLTSVMILIFLGSMRATVAVFFSIPLSALATFIALSLGGGIDQQHGAGRAGAGVLAADRQLRGGAGEHLPASGDWARRRRWRRKRAGAKWRCRCSPRR